MKIIHRHSLVLWGIFLISTLSCTQFYAQNYGETISDEVLMQNFERYLPELAYADHETILESLFRANQTPPDVQRTILETIYNNVISSNPYKDKTAKVRTFTSFVPKRVSPSIKP